MRRVVIALALALVTLQGVRLVASLVPDACADGCLDGCAGDRPDGTCPPGCDECACCPVSRVIPGASGIVVEAPQATRHPHGPAARAPADGEPRDILHVPKRS